MQRRSRGFHRDYGANRGSVIVTLVRHAPVVSALRCNVNRVVRLNHEVEIPSTSPDRRRTVSRETGAPSKTPASHRMRITSYRKAQTIRITVRTPATNPMIAIGTVVERFWGGSG
jgi:hypothetical protein